MSLDIHLTCEHCNHDTFSANITHNLGQMADVAGLYDPLWRPEENGIERARQLIEPLTVGIAKMKAEPERFKLMDSPNGWGLYEHFVPWLEELLAACIENPNTRVEVST